ncbi:gp436 family protein [Oligella urethralis]|uniref:gp436 family protein n=1 Tax=Oligella urethralis TaxID=90245 RepID=UPI000DFC6A9B|nr:DUF1320 domain-containing protein [Oligella urethralis]SUA58101.1 Mu-like prophage protein gp36 [Oligella urethralis]
MDDLRLVVPPQTLVWLSNDDHDATEPNVAIVQESIRQATEQVNAYIRNRYTLPLEPIPTLVKDITVNLARHWLYSRRPEGHDFPEAVTRTYKDALALLAMIRDNKVSLGIRNDEADAPEPGAMKVKAKPKLFDWSRYK